MLEGLPPNQATHVMRLRCPEPVARRVADLIVETFDPAETAAAAFEDGATSTWAGAPWAVEVFFARAPDESAVRALVAIAAEGEPPDVEFARVSQQDWVASSLAGLRGVRAIP